MKLGEIIKSYISEHDISVREFARKSNLSNTYISNIVNGSDKNPSLDVLGKIAKAMGLSSQQLFDCLDGEQAFAINQKAIQRIPLYTSISCGTGLFVDDQVEDYIAIPDKYIKPGRDYFANTASGDSMIGKGIKEGDVLVFEKTNIIENGEIGMNHRPHETRHTCASLLADHKIEPRTIKKILGHSGAMDLTEKVYTHLDDKVLLDAINTL